MNLSGFRKLPVYKLLLQNDGRIYIKNAVKEQKIIPKKNQPMNSYLKRWLFSYLNKKSESSS